MDEQKITTDFQPARTARPIVYIQLTIVAALGLASFLNGRGESESIFVALIYCGLVVFPLGGLSLMWNAIATPMRERDAGFLVLIEIAMAVVMWLAILPAIQ